MDNAEQNPQPAPITAHILNERQWRVHTLLAQRSPVLGNRYRAILMAFSATDNPESLVQAAHSARFLIKHLYMINPDVPVFRDHGDAFSMIREFARAWEGPDTNGDEIAKASQKLVDYLREASQTRNVQLTDLFVKEDISEMASQEHLSPLIEMLSGKIRFFDKIAHFKADGIKKDDFETALYEVEGVIIGLLSEHFDLLPEVERLLGIEIPTAQHITEVKGLIPQPQLFMNFFRRLEHPGWFEPLAREGFFKTPRKTKRHQDGVSAPPWPQGWFLKKCAPIFPEKVIKAILDADDTDNWSVLTQFVEIGLFTPATEVAKLVGKKTELWLKRFNPGNLPLALAKLVVHLADAGENNAFELAKQLLSLKRTPPPEDPEEAHGISELRGVVAQFDEHIYEKVMKSIVPSLARSNAFRTIDLLCETLNRAIQLQGPNRELDPKNDGLELHRPTIPNSEGNKYGNHYIKSLIDTLRDALSEMANGNPGQAGQCLKLLRKYRPHIFLRIELHILSQYPTHFLGRIEELITDPLIVRCPRTEFELDVLLDAAFGLLPDVAQASYLKIIEEGPATNGQ